MDLSRTQNKSDDLGLIVSLWPASLLNTSVAQDFNNEHEAYLPEANI